MISIKHLMRVCICAAIPIFLIFGVMRAYAKPREVLPSLAAAEQCRLLKDGVPDCAVILPPTPHEDELEGANILVKYLSKLSSGRRVKLAASDADAGNVKVKIYLKKNPDSGAPKPFDRNFDGAKLYVFKVSANSIEILYPELQNAIPAVGYFLKEYLGFKFMYPADGGIIIPTAKNISLKLGEKTFQPSFLGSYIGSWRSPQERELYYLNAQDTSLVHYTHSVQFVLTQKIYEEMPKLFASIKGRRMSPAENSQVQPDYLNAAVPLLYEQKALEYFKEKPLKNLFSVSAADSSLFDEAPLTQALVRGNYESLPNYSDIFFGFADRTARLLMKSAPSKFLYALAYRQTKDAPDFKIAPNIIVYIAADRMNYYSPAFKREDFTLTKKWSQSGAKLFGFYDYNYGNNYFIPRYAPQFFAESVKMLCDLGGRVYTAEFYPFYPYDGAKFWLISNMLKDAYQEPSALLKEYFETCYDISAPEVAEFFELAQDAWKERLDEPRWLALYKKESAAELFPKRRLDKMQTALDAAFKKPNIPAVKTRLEDLKLAFEMTKAYCQSYFAKKRLFYNPLQTLKDFEDAAREIDNIAFHAFKKKIVDEALKNKPENFPPDLSRFTGRADTDFAESAVLLLIGQGKLPKNIEDAARDFLGDAAMQNLKRAQNLSANFLQNDFKNLGGALPEGWKQYLTPYAGAKIYTQESGGKTFLCFKDVEYSGLHKTLACVPKRIYVLSAKLEGTISLGAVAYLRMVFFDSSNVKIAERTFILPRIDSAKPLEAALAQEAPAGAARVSVGVFCNNPASSDTLRASDISLKMEMPRKLD